MPLQRSPQDENSVITQFEMHSVEDLGLLKIDLLGLKNLTIIEETIRLIKETNDLVLNISTIPLNDAETYKLLQTGETTGVFQFESAGMRRYMKDLEPTELEDLIALVALYRPGTMELIPSFIKRKFGKEKVEYLHPKLEPILKNTYGIGVYQEQMMRIARDLAGFSLPEADTLRKAIGKKIKSLLDAQKEKLIKGMVENGVGVRVAGSIWELFPPFARYGFNRSHAACYALIGYQTAYLKTHYPVEFMTALLNNAAGDVERVSFLVNDAKRVKIDVLPPDVNKSVNVFVPEGGNVRFGILAVKNIGTNIATIIVDERLRGGPYKSLGDFMTRINDRDLNKKSLEALIKSGAFDSLGIERMSALKSMDDILKRANGVKKMNGQNQANLFGSSLQSNFEIKLQPTEPASKTERLAWEKELLGLYITDHPLKEYFEAAETQGKKLPLIRDALQER
ncbi:MAG: DNA polymerase III subunit alpha, partial [Candidatus Colwellbacteria bacterium]|nr:DNA polymerase III subunit alpha [Candidatus Colwellbacteria bacterium]